MTNKDLDYHEDSDQRMIGERHAAIVLKKHEVLLIHRIKNGHEYYVFPGGHRRKDETGSETVIREVCEETAIQVTSPRLVFEFKDHINKNTDFYYLCTSKSNNKLKLMGEEKMKNSPENYYEPIWIDLTKAPNLNILPYFAKYWLLDYLPKVGIVQWK